MDSIALIKDKEIWHLIPEEFCSMCSSKCRIRKYIVQITCCDLMACNQCHIQHLEGTTRPYCMYCKTVWTQDDISKMFTTNDCRRLLKSRAANYLQIVSTYNDIREEIAAIAKEQLVPLLPLIAKGMSRLDKEDTAPKYNSLLKMLTLPNRTRPLLRKSRKMNSLDLKSLMNIDESDIFQLTSDYCWNSERPTKNMKRIEKQLERAASPLYRTVREMQQIVEDSTIGNCPTCSKPMLDYDSNNLHSIECLYCNTVLSTVDYTVVVAPKYEVYSNEVTFSALCIAQKKATLNSIETALRTQSKSI